MAVMNIDRVYFCCLYGNSEDEAIIRRIDRDMAYEEELIALDGTSGRIMSSQKRRLPMWKRTAT